MTFLYPNVLYALILPALLAAAAWWLAPPFQKMGSARFAGIPAGTG